MEPRTQERVEQWDSRPFNGGYDGLSDLADADFSGAVAAAGTWLFMLNGRVVGVVDGSIEDFEAASGTAYEAPDPALPLLCTMEERGGETRAKYYTNETPLREVDGTLQSGSFTGYVELSENVLSGDYYAVYYGGRRMAAAYIGNAERLLTGDEAFERAADEVGIYEVRDVEIEVTDVPGSGADPQPTADDSKAAGDAEPDASDAPDSSDDVEIGGIDLGASVGDDADATGAGSEPSVDPTESAIDSIDLSGADPESAADEGGSAPIEDVSIGDAAAAPSAEPADESAAAPSDEPSGITATDDADPEPAASGITEADAGAGTSADAADAVETAANDEPSPADAGPATDERTAGESSRADAGATETTFDESARSGGDATESAGGEPRVAERESTTDADADTGGSGPDPAEVEAAAEQLDQNDISWTEDDVESTGDESSTASSAESTVAAGSTAEAAASAPENEERFQQEAQWRETRSIPSIDPDNSETDDSSRTGATARSGSTQRSSSGRGSDAGSARSDAENREAAGRSASSNRQQRQQGQQSQQRQQGGAAGAGGSRRTDRADASGARGASGSGAAAADAGGDDERIAELADRIETLEEQRDALAAKAEELETERDRLRSENEELSSTVDRLQSRIEELETELERARQSSADEGDAAPAASTQLSPQRALAGTNLFVRYASKSQPTLESAHDGAGDRTEVAANLRLERHTEFDAADVAVDGRPYEEFLTGSMEHRFVDWLTGMLLFEIRDTGNADALADLYDAIPRIDRAELDATISLEDDETEDVPDQVTFDVVAFDKMGNPLLLANLNDSREPATQGMLEELEEAASAVKANYPDLAAAVVVTSSYFEPGALEVAEQATSGGLLSRGSKLSYVNLSRKQGYHLCLIESRSEGFHMNVPEL